MTDKKLTPEEQAKADEKQLKKLLESYTAVAAHKLGRPPTLEDLTKMMTENQGQESLATVATQTPMASRNPGERSIDRTSDTAPKQAPQELDKTSEAHGEPDGDEGVDAGPKILHMKVYYGMSGEGEGRKPDPANILYYESPDGKCYDCNAQAWSDKRPLLADHLPSRPIQFNEKDIVGAMMHGVMDDHDYDALDKAQMISDTPRRLWELTKKLKGYNEELAKSTEIEQEDTDDEPEVDPELTAGAPTEGKGVDAVGEFMSTAGVERGSQDETGGESEVGEDLIKQIMDAAVAAVSEEMGNNVRQIVREELARHGIGQATDPADEDLSTESPEDGTVKES